MTAAALTGGPHLLTRRIALVRGLDGALAGLLADASTGGLVAVAAPEARSAAFARSALDRLVTEIEGRLWSAAA